MLFGFALGGPQNVFLFKSILKIKVGELIFYFRLSPTLVASVFTILFTQVLSWQVC